MDDSKRKQRRGDYLSKREDQKRRKLSARGEVASARKAVLLNPRSGRGGAYSKSRDIGGDTLRVKERRARVPKR